MLFCRYSLSFWTVYTLLLFNFFTSSYNTFLKQHACQRKFILLGSYYSDENRYAVKYLMRRWCDELNCTSLIIKPADEKKGLGLFTTTLLLKGTPIGVYKGETISWKQYVTRYPTGKSEYVFLLNPEAQRRDRIYVDAIDASKSNHMRYMNHDEWSPTVEGTTIDFSSLLPELFKRYCSTKFLNTAQAGIMQRELVRSSEIGVSRYYAVFKVCRDVDPDQELCFDYGESYNAPWRDVLRKSRMSAETEL